MKRQSNADRSVMFAALLELSPKYGALPVTTSHKIIGEALVAWYDSTADDMYRFAREWITKNRKDLLPLRWGS